MKTCKCGNTIAVDADYCSKKCEESCLSDECLNVGTSDNGYCEECEFERQVARADALHDRMKEGD